MNSISVISSLPDISSVTAVTKDGQSAMSILENTALLDNLISKATDRSMSQLPVIITTKMPACCCELRLSDSEMLRFHEFENEDSVAAYGKISASDMPRVEWVDVKGLKRFVALLIHAISAGDEFVGYFAVRSFDVPSFR